MVFIPSLRGLARALNWLNILTLLKDGAKTTKELYKSGYFSSELELHKALTYMVYIGYIEQINLGNPRVYCILSKGWNLLNQYPSWEFERLGEEGIIVSLGNG
jgi:hypothetical protein